MSIVIDRVAGPTPGLAAFLLAHHADMEGTAPPESRHALPLDALLAPGIRLFAARDGDLLVATGALAPIEEQHEELKSMRTDPARRGEGLGRRVLHVLLDDARRRGIRRVSLETGSAEFFHPARSLYSRAGFRACPPFADYAPDPHSVFLTIDLSAP
ncbi:GNAT family N-acetyltransferase [Microbacterium sp. 179-I 3D4 NHS]|uniref:GNAT family N-acetyltransferase n=1 Tax=Microbacterium sp. 179-I 3D4 NHS TaxID=3142381 RepID=UPI0039A31329